ncbi:phosphotransferase [Cyclobacterium jeungdonense]|uniref:Phosphotransferase n=1 Tax=Cyclobacterium jeungdonense TaxID=708087 RepID=A0ABT8CBJ2_9BACT|nr:phosphotransferase [Cyclobacterium jeungdonense]MDN3690175.1 phosphotransferase [Cyclobacterium jeungdonense]
MPSIASQILHCTGATAIRKMAHVQTLWSGYGSIKRYVLEGGKYPSVIVKHILLPESGIHPRGWNTDLSHQRKVKSYAVESYWYQHYARLTGPDCKMPRLLHAAEEGSMRLLVMEDLNALGFPGRLMPDTVTLAAAKNCLAWLARFHARFMQVSPEGLWEIGAYWHLDTRPDEWAKMKHIPLQQAASAIDQKLNAAAYQTLVHGDAKLANFCFGPEHQVAAVDFQYVGKGCGIKDVAYFISSCFAEEACEAYEDELLGHYFKVLEMDMDKCIDFQLVKQEWTELYKFAWADLYRFLDGWSAGHWKMHGYSERLTRSVLEELNFV